MTANLLVYNLNSKIKIYLKKSNIKNIDNIIMCSRFNGTRFRRGVFYINKKNEAPSLSNKTFDIVKQTFKNLKKVCVKKSRFTWEFNKKKFASLGGARGFNQKTVREGSVYKLNFSYSRRVKFDNPSGYKS